MMGNKALKVDGLRVIGIHFWSDVGLWLLRGFFKF